MERFKIAAHQEKREFSFSREVSSVWLLENIIFVVEEKFKELDELFLINCLKEQ